MPALFAHNIFLLFITITLLAVGVYVLSKERKSLINQSFFLFVCGISLWTVGFVFLSATEDFFFNRIILFGGLLLAYAVFLFSNVFPNRTSISRRAWWLSLPFLAAALLIIPPHLIIQKTVITESGGLQPMNGPLFPVYAFILTLYVALTFYNLIKSYRHSSGRTRLQMKYFFSGLVFIVIMALIFDAILPGINITEFNIFGPLASIVFICFTAYAIVKHQLLDIRVVIQRGLIYSALLAIIVGFYLVLVSVLGLFLQRTTDTAILIAAGITIIVGIFGVPVIDRYLRRVTDKIFFKDRYDYSDALYTLSELFNTTAGLRNTIKRSSDALKNILRVEYVTIEPTPHKKGRTKKSKDDVVILMKENGKITGSILVGKKLSGDPFTQEDYALMKTFAQQASVALEKARLFKEVDDYASNLEQKVTDRTREIQRLQEDQEQMIIDISHGLQNPLTVAKMEIETVREKMPEHAAFNTLERSVDEISNFIYQLMHLARLERGVYFFEQERVNVSDLLLELVEYFEVLAADKNIELVSIIEPDIYFLGEKKSLEELVVNLVSNAIKYNVRDISDKKVFIGLKEKGDTIVLTVQDTGVGIAKNELPHIFDRFHRAKEAKTSDVKGTGLGLAITRKIVELHGGTIGAQSSEGEGTTFTVIFPKNA